MAELLILNRDNRTGDRAIDAARYRRGDVVAVMPDGHRWGKLETLPDFVRVKVPGVPVETLQDLLTPDESELFDADGTRTMRARRKTRLAIARLAKPERDALQVSGELTLPARTLREQMQAE